MINQPQLVLSSQSQEHIDMSEAELVFLVGNNEEYILQFPFSHQDIAGFLSHKISRTPKKLITHVQRVFHCYKENLSDQLYAALVDLLIALQGNKEGLGRRMFNGTKHRLTDKDCKTLTQFFKKKDSDVSQLPINVYSVLGSGRISAAQLIAIGDQIETVSHDPLMLARDFIEYSQLAEAREVLETAIAEHPENKALHEELLDLYKSTRDTVHFKKMYQHVQNQGSPLLVLWDQLKPLLEDELHEG